MKNSFSPQFTNGKMKNIPIIWKKTPDDDDTRKKTKMDEFDDL